LPCSKPQKRLESKGFLEVAIGKTEVRRFPDNETVYSQFRQAVNGLTKKNRCLLPIYHPF